ncbi:MAG: helix-hairpin-helix domain-containing protein [Clostridia bacterium]|nr:helix-hairpin-helix domain-containing protein [Clostridia bacterium]
MTKDRRNRAVRMLKCIILAVPAILLLLPVLMSDQKPQSDHYISRQISDTILPIVTLAPDSFLNTSDARALEELPGIGEVISQRMVETRQAIGGFDIPEDLLLVKGIGEKRLQEIIDYLWPQE